MKLNKIKFVLVEKEVSRMLPLKDLETKYASVPKTEFNPLTNNLTDYFMEAYDKLNVYGL